MSNTKKSGQNFLTGAAILSAATMIVKVIGMFYKIPLQQLIGENGYAYFTAAYDIYTVLLVISTTGLPVAMSRMVSEAKTLGNGKQMQRIFHTALMVYLILGCLGTGLMMLLPNLLADQVMGLPNASYSIFALGPAVIFICLASAGRGYFQGQGDMRPTGVSQIIEALGKLLFGLGLATWLMKAGYSLDIVVAGAIGGGGRGSIALMRGHARNQRLVLYVAVIILVVLVQIIQSIGTKLTIKTDKRINK